MKQLGLHFSLAAGLAVVFLSAMPHSVLSDLKPTESDKPVLFFRAIDVTPQTRFDDTSSHAELVYKLLADGPKVFSVRSITPSGDGVGVNVTLNEKDRDALVDLAHRFPGKYLYCSIPGRRASVVVFPIDKTVAAMFTFSRSKGEASGDIAEYLRKRFRLTAVSVGATSFAGDIKSVDSDAPIVQIFELTPMPAKSDKPNVPTFGIGDQPLLTISSIRNLIVAADGKSVAMVLNADDTKKYAELTRKFADRVLFFKYSSKPPIGVVGKVTPTEDGIIESSEARGTGNIAEYLRKRFGK